VETKNIYMHSLELGKGHNRSKYFILGYKHFFLTKSSRTTIDEGKEKLRTKISMCCEIKNIYLKICENCRLNVVSLPTQLQGLATS
jgi:hypothetical protein